MIKQQMAVVYKGCLILFLLVHAGFSQPDGAKSKKKHKNSDTVGVVNGIVIRLYDFRQQLSQFIRDAKKGSKDTIVSDTAFTHFVGMTWDKLVSDVVVEQEIEKRKLSMNNEQTIEKLLKNPSKELKEVFTDSLGAFSPKAMKAYMKNTGPDPQRTKILDYYQILFEQQRLATELAPKVRSEDERLRLLGLWLKEMIGKAIIDDRRTSFGYY